MTDRPRPAIPPALALGAAAVAIVLVTVMVARLREPAPAAPPAPAPAPAPIAAPLPVIAPPAPPPPSVAPIADPTPPEIKAVTATVAAADLGVELRLETALIVPAGVGPREMLSIRARCHIDGEWYDGSGGILLGRLGAGTQVIVSKLAVGRPHQLAALPTACHLGFDYLGGVPSPRDRGWLAHLCWNGREVVAEPCPPVARARPLVELHALRVESSLARRSTYVAGTPLGLDVAIEAEAHDSLDRWTLAIAAECRMPDGTTQRDAGRFSLYSVHPGKPFAQKTWLFGPAKLAALPAACTLTLELIDTWRLVREPVGLRCWHDGTIDPGPCR